MITRALSQGLADLCQSLVLFRHLSLFGRHLLKVLATVPLPIEPSYMLIKIEREMCASMGLRRGDSVKESVCSISQNGGLDCCLDTRTESVFPGELGADLLPLGKRYGGSEGTLRRV